MRGIAFGILSAAATGLKPFNLDYLVIAVVVEQLPIRPVVVVLVVIAHQPELREPTLVRKVL